MIHTAEETWQIILCRVGDDKQVTMAVDVNAEVENINGYPFKNIDLVSIMLVQISVLLPKNIFAVANHRHHIYLLLQLLEKIQKDIIDKMFPPTEIKDKENPPTNQPPRPQPPEQPPHREPRPPFPDYPRMYNRTKAYFML